MHELKFQQFCMTKAKSLLDGIGKQKITEKYYDDWASNYDQTLNNWNYKAPKQAVEILYKIKKACFLQAFFII